MIIVKLSGGLGNQMFQYATGLCLASRNADTLKIDLSYYKKNNKHDTPREFGLDKLNCDYQIATLDDLKKIRPMFNVLPKLYSLIKEKLFNKYYYDYHEEIFNWKNKIYLNGYFQSEKNFLEISSLIKQKFSLKNEYIEQINQVIVSQIRSKNSISLHVRRGDYAQDEKTRKYHGLCPISFYQDAISLITKKFSDPHFFIFSDDIEWVKKNLSLPENFTVVSDGKLIPQQEMYLMSQCKHNIIANSTFSWWGAWLNENPGKVVVAPMRWVNIEPNPHPNIIPETWIKI